MLSQQNVLEKPTNTASSSNISAEPREEATKEVSGPSPRQAGLSTKARQKLREAKQRSAKLLLATLYKSIEENQEKRNELNDKSRNQ